MSRRAISLVMLAALCGAPSCAGALTVAEAYTSVSLSPPTTTLVIICHGIGCQLRTAIGLTAGDRARLAELLAPGRASAAAERSAVAAAAAWFDKRVGPAAGTTHRLARAHASAPETAGQMDCIDTSRNTTSLLLILEQLHLLHHHKVEGPEARGYVINLVGPHATAVLTDIHTGRQWAVDSWTHKYGERPDIMLLDEWMKKE